MLTHDWGLRFRCNLLNYMYHVLCINYIDLWVNKLDVILSDKRLISSDRILEERLKVRWEVDNYELWEINSQFEVLNTNGDRKAKEEIFQQRLQETSKSHSICFLWSGRGLRLYFWSIRFFPLEKLFIKVWNTKESRYISSGLSQRCFLLFFQNWLCIHSMTGWDYSRSLKSLHQK